MKKLLGLLLAFLVTRSADAGGFVITIENDFFSESDGNYTHATEFDWVELGSDKNISPVRTEYGLRQSFYTPENITIATNQPDQRPWCGILAAKYERWTLEGDETVRIIYEVGILGPSSGAETSQTEVHRLLDNRLPEGWDNQLEDEPVLNLYYERYHPLASVGDNRGLGAKLEGTYGGTIGTTFDNMKIGPSLKVGWNVPVAHLTGGMEPKVVSRRPFAYAFADADRMLVIHNATICDSFFHPNETELELEPWVGEARYGFSIGVSWFAVTYAKAIRSLEFEGQEEPMDWGLARMEFVREF